MEIYFHERKEDGAPDETWFVNLGEDKLKEYRIKAGVYLDEEKYSALGKAEKREGVVNEIIRSTVPYETPQHKTPAVFFTAPNNSPGVGAERVCLYWIERLGYWVGVSDFFQMVSSHTSAECHEGPYRVEGVLATKLLEAYGLDNQSVAGREVSGIPPSELEELASKQK